MVRSTVLIHFSVKEFHEISIKPRIWKAFQHSPCSFLLKQKLIMEEAIQRYLQMRLTKQENFEHANLMYSQPTTASIWASTRLENFVMMYGN